MLDRRGYVKLIDFGFCKLLQDPARRTFTPCGTPAYMAPEMANPPKPGDVSSGASLDSVEAGKAIDIYSFGICLLELWTQQKPYAGQRLNAFQLMVKVMSGDRPALPGPDVVPAGVAALIQRCWVQEPHMRPSFDEICMALEISNQERLRWTKDGRLKTSGTLTFTTGRRVTVPTYSAHWVADLLKNNRLIDGWRKQDTA